MELVVRFLMFVEKEGEELLVQRKELHNLVLLEQRLMQEQMV
jgi:hypothetical protein